MNDWARCPGCGLKHTVREDGLCPRCHQPVLQAERGDLPDNLRLLALVLLPVELLDPRPSPEGGDGLVRVVAVGTGQALKNAKNGDGDFSLYAIGSSGTVESRVRPLRNAAR